MREESHSGSPARPTSVSAAIDVAVFALEQEWAWLLKLAQLAVPRERKQMKISANVVDLVKQGLKDLDSENANVRPLEKQGLKILTVQS
nr:hypothetical protein Iba_scaffold5767CG0800 [Ipomoea batatas]